MAKLPIAVTTSDEAENSLTLTFTKKDFSSFVFNLFVTPRDERRGFILGFDLFKSDLKKIVDKLDYHVRTHHELLNQSLLIDLRLAEGVELTYSTGAQFFDVDDPRNERVSLVWITFTYVIAFFRDGKKSFEKQQIDLGFYAGKVGKAIVSIRSTDVSWPNGIFAIIERELKDVSSRSVGHNAKLLRSPPYQTSFESIATVQETLSSGLMNSLRTILDIRNDPRYYILIVSILTIATMILSFPILLNFKYSSGWVVSKDFMSVIEGSAPLLIEQYGVEKAAEMLRVGKVLHDSGMPVSSAYFTSKLGDYFSNVPHLIYIFGVIVTVLFFVLAWKSSVEKLSLVGRLFVFGEKTTPRESPSTLSSILPSLAVGLVASLLATLLWELMKL